VVGRRRAILCLCHDSNMLEIRRMLLEHFGYVVLPSASAGHAKTVAEQQCPDMLLMDNSDPGMDYTLLAEQVKRVCPSVITVVLTPYFRVSHNGPLASIDRFVVKDDGPDALLAQIEELFGESPDPDLHPA